MKKEQTPLKFRVDTVALLHEIANCGLPITQGILKLPLNIFKNLLAEVAERAININDPELNILMLSLGLYEVPPNKINSCIEEQRKKINV